MKEKLERFNPLDLSTLPSWSTGLVQFWVERIVDPQGGYFERLNSESRPINDPVRQPFVVARLIFTFAEAFSRTGLYEFESAAKHGMAFLLDRCRSEQGGWFKAIGSESSVQDTYTQAFVLLAFSSYLRVFKDPTAAREAEATWSFIEAFLRDARSGGLLERFDPEDPSPVFPRTQNASMHLLEAALSLFSVTGDRVWLNRATELIEFATEHFIDPRTGGVIEFLDEDWREWTKPLKTSSAPDKAVAARQTGHVLERAKLLLEYSHLAGDRSAAALADRLCDFATGGLELGGPLAGTVSDGLDRDGVCLNGPRSFWQSLEFLALLAARNRILGENVEEPVRTVLAAIEKNFVRSDGASWHNQISNEGVPLGDGTSAARLLYHLYPAITACQDLK